MYERTRMGYSFSLSDLFCDEDETSLNHESYESETYLGLNLSSVSEDQVEYIGKLAQMESGTGFGSKSSLSSSGDCSSTSRSWLKCARLEAIEWIFRVCSLPTRQVFGFLFHTAYISVSYFDHFLSILPINDGELWATRSLALACLSLAAKVEESNMMKLSGLAGYKWEVTLKNEQIILEALEWEMHSITPFHYLHYFVNKFCGESRLTGLVSKAVELTMDVTREFNLMDYRPSIIAASAVLVAIYGQLTKEEFEIKMSVISLWGSLENEQILSCYNIMQNMEMRGVNSRWPARFSYLSMNSSLTGVIESSSHPVAHRIKRKLGFAFANPGQKRSRQTYETGL